MRLRVAMLVLVVAAVGSGCGSVGSNDWALIGATPDEQHLLVTTLFGGVSSGCTRWEGWEVDESADRVEIKALLWTKRFPGGCTDEGITETIEVDLVEPLGDRDLIGCGADDCFSSEIPPWLGARDLDSVVTPSGVAVSSAGWLWGFGASGEILWNLERGRLRLFETAVDVVVGDDGRGVTGFDAKTGSELWQTEGSVAAVGAGVVFVCRGMDAEGVAAVDIATGVDLWSVDVPCELVVPADDVITIVAGDRAVDRGSELVLVDPATGDLILRDVFDDGVNDRVIGFEGAVLAGDGVVVAGRQANLVVLGADGQELLRRPDGIGNPIGVVDGLVIVVAHDRVASVDPISGETIWVSQELTRLTVSVSGDALWSLDSAAGTVSRVDPRSGEKIWTAPIGVTSDFDVAADEMVTYVTGSLNVTALDTTNGEIHWWQHLPYEQPSRED